MDKTIHNSWSVEDLDKFTKESKAQGLKFKFNGLCVPRVDFEGKSKDTKEASKP